MVLRIGVATAALLSLALVVAAAMTLGARELMRAETRDLRFANPAEVPSERVAVVLGAGVLADGRPSPMLAARIEAAVALYETGRVKKLLMSGDNSRFDYDEVGVMRRYAIGRGVPAEDIAMDHAGFSTYETCYRAREVFGLDRAVIVTQSYHLPRAVYTCRGLGVEAVGLGAPDWGVYSDDLMTRYTAREVAATLKALVQVHVTRPPPTYLGAPVQIG